jgi:hypothetical protein
MIRMAGQPGKRKYGSNKPAKGKPQEKRRNMLNSEVCAFPVIHSD